MTADVLVRLALRHAFRHVVERVANGGTVGLVVRQIGQSDVGVEARLAGAALLAVEQRARDVVSVLGGIFEMQVPRLVAELIDADRQHVQHAARRLGAAGRFLNGQSAGRQLGDPERPRGFELLKNQGQRVAADGVLGWPIQVGSSPALSGP